MRTKHNLLGLVKHPIISYRLWFATSISNTPSVHLLHQMWLRDLNLLFSSIHFCCVQLPYLGLPTGWSLHWELWFKKPFVPSVVRHLNNNLSVIFLSWSVEWPNLFEVTRYIHHALVLCYSVCCFYILCVTGLLYVVLLQPPAIHIVYICT